MKKLISMTDFVLEQGKHDVDADLFYFLCSNYAQFLKQPLTLGMFLPVDEDGNVLEEPREDDYSFYTHNNKSVHEEYSEAKERVLFEGFEVIHSDKVRITIQYEFSQLDYNILRVRFEGYNTIECLTGCHLDLTLTPYALKQIGL